MNTLKEAINFVKDCDSVDFYLLFDKVRERHNDKMINNF